MCRPIRWVRTPFLRWVCASNGAALRYMNGQASALPLGTHTIPANGVHTCRVGPSTRLLSAARCNNTVAGHSPGIVQYHASGSAPLVTLSMQYAMYQTGKIPIVVRHYTNIIFVVGKKFNSVLQTSPTVPSNLPLSPVSYQIFLTSPHKIALCGVDGQHPP